MLFVREQRMFFVREQSSCICGDRTELTGILMVTEQSSRMPRQYLGVVLHETTPPIYVHGEPYTSWFM